MRAYRRIHAPTLAALTVALVLAGVAPVAADQCIADDLIVDGSACVGFDCVCGESFGFDTIRLKENNLRIAFIDTSVAASFPRGDWQLRANESTNGGANEFAIDWLGTGATSGSSIVSTPFAIEGDAPNNALYVDDGGRVGLGTSVPSVELHVVDGDSPALRLAQDGSSGFTPQTWDVVGNETNFFVRDVTNGSALPLRIRPGADSNSIFIDSDNDVGMGTSSPSFDLNIRKTDADPTFLEIENANAAGQLVGVSLVNSDASYIFQVNASGNFQITQGGTGGAEFDIIDGAAGNADKFAFRNGATQLVEIQADGDVNSLTGSFGTISDRNAKTDIRPVDPRDVLARVSAMPISTWRYKVNSDELHLGPMGQDFWAAFGLYEGPTSISLSDLSGVALAAVQGLDHEVRDLNRAVEERDALIRKLTERLDALEARLGE